MRKKVVFLLFIFLLFNFYIDNNEIHQSSGSIVHDEAIDAVLKIISDSDFFLLGINGTGTENDPFLIENLNIKSQEKGGIYISNTTKHYRINNCTLETIQYGIYAKNCSMGTVTILNNNLNISRLAYNALGIFIEETDGVELSNNECIGGSYGISVSEVENISVLKNNCSFNKIGIFLQHVKNSLLEMNHCSNNTYEGISLHNCLSITISQNTCILNAEYEIMTGDYISNGIGIDIYSSEYCLVIGNNCSENSDSGIVYFASDYSVAYNNSLRSNKRGITIWYSTGDFLFYDEQTEISIVYNYITNNEEYGIENWGSRSCYIYSNIFTNNNVEGTSEGYSQARDGRKSGTKWYDEETSIGNYWSDWNFISNYKIDGNRIESWNYDPYPIANLSEMVIPPQPSFTNSVWFPNDGFYTVRYFSCLIGFVTIITMLVIISKFRRKKRREYYLSSNTISEET